MADEQTDKVEFSEAQQKLVDELVGNARIKAREKAKVDNEADQSKASAEAERANLAAQEEWQKLATNHEARVKELEPLEVEVKAYRELVSGMLKDRVKALGDAAKKAVAGLPDGMSTLQKLDWLNKNVGLFQAGSDGVGTPNRSKGGTLSVDKPKGKRGRFPIRL